MTDTNPEAGSNENDVARVPVDVRRVIAYAGSRGEQMAASAALERWTARMAPTLDAEGWQRAERDAVHWRSSSGWACAVSRRWSVEEAGALLAHRDKVADGLKSGAWRFRLYQARTGRPRPLISCSTWRVLLRRGLVHSPDRRTAEATDFGHEIGRVLAERLDGASTAPRSETT